MLVLSPQLDLTSPLSPLLPADAVAAAAATVQLEHAAAAAAADASSVPSLLLYSLLSPLADELQ
jgi:hypothetical protein